MNITLKILRFLGPTFLFFGFFVVFPPLLMSLFSGNTNNTLLYIFIVSMIYSIIILFTLRKKKLNYMPRDGFLITFVCWVLISIVASVPFYSTGMNPSDSFFEAVSGLTTTGSTSINDLSLLSNDILIYRQLLQWAGGVGLVIVVLAIIPAISGGMRVLQAETSGFADKSFSPRLKETARSLLLFYLGINKELDIPHHALFFDTDFDKHAEEIYDKPQWPKNPLFYVSCTSKTDNSVAPKGSEAVLSLIHI